MEILPQGPLKALIKSVTTCSECQDTHDPPEFVIVYRVWQIMHMACYRQWCIARKKLLYQYDDFVFDLCYQTNNWYKLDPTNTDEILRLIENTTTCIICNNIQVVPKFMFVCGGIIVHELCARRWLNTNPINDLFGKRLKHKEYSRCDLANNVYQFALEHTTIYDEKIQELTRDDIHFSPDRLITIIPLLEFPRAIRLLNNDIIRKFAIDCFACDINDRRCNPTYNVFPSPLNPYPPNVITSISDAILHKSELLISTLMQEYFNNNILLVLSKLLKQPLTHHVSDAIIRWAKVKFIQYEYKTHLSPADEKSDPDPDPDPYYDMYDYIERKEKELYKLQVGDLHAKIQLVVNNVPYTIIKKHALSSMHIRRFFERFPQETVMHLTRITHPELFPSIIKYLNHHKGIEHPFWDHFEFENVRENHNDPWDTNFINDLAKNVQHVYNLTTDANYLILTPLLHLACVKIASLVRAKQ